MKLHPTTLQLTDDGAQPDAGAPWWVRVGYRVGVPSAMAVFLLWFLASNVSAELKAQRELLEMHNRSQSAQQRELLYLVRAICVNAAKDDGQRSLCSPPQTSDEWPRR